MSTLAVNDDNDIYAVNGVLQFLPSGAEATSQTVKRRMQTYLGEVLYNVNEGVDYFGTVFNGSPNVLTFESSARSNILDVQDVTGIESFTAEASNNVLTYTAEINTIYGTITVNNTTNNS